MSLAAFALGETSIAQVEGSSGSAKKAPSKRTATALSDRTAVPEPR